MENWRETKCGKCKIQRGKPICNHCMNYDKFVPMTNADRIRTMTDEELAKSRVRAVAVTIDGDELPGMYEFETSFCGTFSTRKAAEDAELHWLQSEVEI